MSPLGCCSYLAEHNSLPSQQRHLDLRGVLLVGADDHHNCGLWGEPKGQTPFWRLLDSQASSSQSVLGKFVGGFCALVGVFTITLPIPIVVNSFAGFYKNTLMRNEVNSKKRERLKSERHKWRKELQESVTRGGISSEEVNKIIRILSTIFTRYPQLTDLVFAPLLYILISWFISSDHTHPGLFQAEIELQRRVNKDMTVADMIRIGYWAFRNFRLLRSVWITSSLLIQTMI